MRDHLNILGCRLSGDRDTEEGVELSGKARPPGFYGIIEGYESRSVGSSLVPSCRVCSTQLKVSKPH